MTPGRERARLRQSGAVAGLCPVTEANLGDGIFAAPRFAAAGGRMAIGTDSNVRIALNEELRTLEYGQRLRDQKRNRLGPVGASTGRHLFDCARRGGAQALGLAGGALAVGRARTSSSWTTPTPRSPAAADQLIDAWVFAAGDGAVHTVFAGGRRVVTDGRHIGREAIRQRFADTMRRLLEDA